MENLNLSQLNAIGEEIGYPFYVFKDGSYGRKFVNGHLNAIMTVKQPFVVDNLQEKSLTEATVKKPQPIKMPQSSAPIIELAKKVTAEQIAKAECGGKVYNNGSIVIRNGFSIAELSGYILWVNPDKTAPIGYRALCCVPDFVEMKLIYLSLDKYLPDAIEAFPDGYANTKAIYKAFRLKGIKTEVWEYITNYAKNGLNPNDCFMISPAEMKAARSANEMVTPLLGLWYGVGTFPMSHWNGYSLEGISMQKDGSCWQGYLFIDRDIKVIPCFWI